MDTPSEKDKEIEVLDDDINDQRKLVTDEKKNKFLSNCKKKDKEKTDILSCEEAEVINLDDIEDVAVFSVSEKETNETIHDSSANYLRNALLEQPVAAKSFQSSKDAKANKSEAEVDVHENGMEDPEEDFKTEKTVLDSDKKESSVLVDNQVQCINLHCQSGYDLGEAPVFALTYFGVIRRKNVLQKVCRECFELALKHQHTLCDMLINRVPLMSADFPIPKDDVVVMDSVEEIYEEEVLPQSIISMVEDQLMDLMKESVDKYELNFQIEKSQEILAQKYENLDKFNKNINNELSSIEKHLTETRNLIYKDFIPKIKNLPPITIMDFAEKFDKPMMVSVPKSRAVATKKITQGNMPKHPSIAPVSESHDVVAVKEVEIPQVKLPPIGNLIYHMLYVGSPVYVMKSSFFGIWVKAIVVENVTRMSEGPNTYRIRFDNANRGYPYKVVSGKQMAYSKASSVRYPVGTRVIALFHNDDNSGKDAFYAGVIAEPPKILNIFRYLVFFDDGYAQYVSHEKILLVCESSKHVYEDIHPDNRDFIKTYLEQYPERPMVKLQKGQYVKTEWNGKWLIARVMAIDGSLAKMQFDADNRTEWIYRGSTRLGPLFSELIAAAARKEQGALSRHRSLGIASLKKRNMPYVEYSVDQDDVKTTQPTTTVSKNVAKKSTASKAVHHDNSHEKCSGPPKPNEKIEYVTKGFVRNINLSARIKTRIFVPHQCGPSCFLWTNYSKNDCKGINPLVIPLFYGFERQRVRVKGKKTIMYRGPCGRRIRNIVEMLRYLRLLKSTMGVDFFDFDYAVHVLDEFHLEPNMYRTHIKDISYGIENTPVSCVNEINHSWPSFMNYSTSRIPQEGVNICLDEEFLVCCNCTDDCQDKEKCECWQLTIEGTKLGPGGNADPSVGYQFKRLPEPVPTGIYECNQRCKCASTCLNRVAQHPLQLNLQVFRTLKKGWGLRTINDIPQGGFICIYAGRLHTEQSANDDGRMYGDEYLAELDYIEVVERFKEGYESDVIEPDGKKNYDEDYPEENDFIDDGADQDEIDEYQMNRHDRDYVPQGFNKFTKTESVVNTRGRYKKINSEEKFEKETEKEKEKKVESEQSKENEKKAESVKESDDDDDEEMKKKPAKFTAAMPVDEDRPLKHKSVRELFGDGADDCYIMDAKSSGNIGRYLNHSCQPNVFVQNVFVDTHDVRFPWVAFFALSHIKAGTELTWDYNYDVGSVPGKVLYCYCNSAECRGRLL